MKVLCSDCGRPIIDHPCPLSPSDETRLKELTDALDAYYLALDLRQHGGAAAARLVDALAGILDRPYFQGQMLAMQKKQEQEKKKP